MNSHQRLVYLKRSVSRSIAHAIAQGMMADYNNFDRYNYLEQCSQLFETLEIKPKHIAHIIKLGHRWGVREYYAMKAGQGMAKEILEAATGAQIHPAETHILTVAEELSDLLFEAEHEEEVLHEQI